MTKVIWYAIIINVAKLNIVYGEMSEWLKELVLKTGNGSAVRGFESRSLLQIRRSTQEAEEAPLLRV